MEDISPFILPQFIYPHIPVNPNIFSKSKGDKMSLPITNFEKPGAYSSITENTLLNYSQRIPTLYLSANCSFNWGSSQDFPPLNL